MIFKDDEYGNFDICLVDDGTLDTVISISHPLTEEEEIRFGSEYAAHYRDETGAVTEAGFLELAEEAKEAFIENHLQ